MPKKKVLDHSHIYTQMQKFEIIYMIYNNIVK